MAEFLVTVDNSAVFELAEPDRTDVVRREHDAARALMASGTLVSIWRLPGQRGNVGVWAAADTDALHEVLTSLPVFPYARFEVRALATHPVTVGSSSPPA